MRLSIGIASNLVVAVETVAISYGIAVPRSKRIVTNVDVIGFAICTHDFTCLFYVACASFCIWANVVVAMFVFCRRLVRLKLRHLRASAANVQQ